MPDIPASPLDVASPDLTISQFCRLSGRSERLVRSWLAAGIITTTGKQEHWPYRLLIPYADLIKAAKQPSWDRRKPRAHVLTSTAGHRVRLHATPPR